jgi:hypothetical protein
MAENYNPDDYTPDQDEYWIGIVNGNPDPADLYSPVDPEDESLNPPAK